MCEYNVWAELAPVAGFMAIALIGTAALMGMIWYFSKRS